MIGVVTVFARNVPVVFRVFGALSRVYVCECWSTSVVVFDFGNPMG